MKTKLTCGKHKIEKEWNPFGGSGHTDYSGYGVHGKHKTEKNRAERRENKRECKNIFSDNF